MHETEHFGMQVKTILGSDICMPKYNTHIKKLFAIRLEPSIINQINLLVKSDQNKFDTKTDVVKFALQNYLFKNRFERNYKIYEAIQRQNKNIFADIHNYIEANNEYVTAINHIGTNVNQIARILNTEAKSTPNSPVMLYSHNLSTIKRANSIINKCAFEIIKNNNQIRADLDKVLDDFNNDSNNQVKKYQRMTDKYTKLVLKVQREINRESKKMGGGK